MGRHLGVDMRENRWVRGWNNKIALRSPASTTTTDRSTLGEADKFREKGEGHGCAVGAIKAKVGQVLSQSLSGLY